MILGRSKQKGANAQPQAQDKAPENVQPAPETAAAGGQATDTPAPRHSIRPKDAGQLRLAQSFAQVVAVLMRDPVFRKLPLGELEWLALPPLMAGQFRLAHLQTQQPGGETQGGMLVPIAVALWARVSPAIDKALSENLDKPARLRPNEWASGDHLWLMAAAGDPRAVPAFLKQLGKTEFKGREVKLRRRGAGGKAIVTTLNMDA